MIYFLLMNSRFGSKQKYFHKWLPMHRSLHYIQIVGGVKQKQLRKNYFFILLTMKISNEGFSAVLYANRHYLRLYRSSDSPRLCRNRAQIIGDVFIDSSAEVSF